MSVAAPSPARTATAPSPEPRLRGESDYDRALSMLMAVVLGALLVVGVLVLVYLTNQAYASRVASPLEIIEVYGGGGGSPDGEVGATEKIDVAGAEAASAASNNEVDAGDFEEPSVMETPAAMIEEAAESGGELAEYDLAPPVRGGGVVASGKRASKLGTGGPAYGFGPGDGGVAREQRWSILYNPGQTPEEYARQLDALGVELATVSGQSLQYVSRLSDPTPRRRIGTGRGDDRLYFLWQGRGRSAQDIELLRKAGLEVGEGVIFHFYPKGVEEQLAQLEVRHRGRQPAEIRVTRFTVVPTGNAYGFKVLDQQTLR